MKYVNVHLLNMKLKRLSFPVVFVIGPPGSGKSFICNEWENADSNHFYKNFDLFSENDHSVDQYTRNQIIDELRATLHSINLITAPIGRKYIIEIHPFMFEILLDDILKFDKFAILSIDGVHQKRLSERVRYFKGKWGSPEQVRRKYIEYVNDLTDFLRQDAENPYDYDYDNSPQYTLYKLTRRVD